MTKEKTIMKKSVSMLLAALMLTGALAGCGSSASGICGASSSSGSSTCEETFSASLSVVFFGSSVQ